MTFVSQGEIMFETIVDFVYKYYIYPITHDSGYNPVNTITWAIILVLSLFGVLKLLDYLDVKIDSELVYALIPFIYVGSSLRVIEDAEIVSPPFKYLLITPLIYFLIAFFVILSLVMGYFLAKKTNFSKKEIVFGSGILISIINSIFLINYGLNHTINSWVPIKIFAIAIMVVTVVFLLLKYLKISFLFKNFLYPTILGFHLFDATSTFVGYRYGAKEKHVVPTFFINLTNTSAVMYPLKVLTILFALWLTDSVFREEEDLKTITLLTLLVLGLAPGLRNTLRLTLGV